jgi:hypothetical protein
MTCLASAEPMYVTTLRCGAQTENSRSQFPSVERGTIIREGM